MNRPQFWAFAGPNGSGKSTFVARFRIADRMPVINPDVIARRLNPDRRNEPALMLRAGRLAATERRALLARGESLAIETTLTGHSELHLLRRARTAGYKTNLVFVGLDDATVALARVREREALGGHSVPADLVLRRYSKSLANLGTALALADRCFVLDNTGNRFRLLLTFDDGQVRHLSRRLPAWAQRAIPRALQDAKGP